MKISLFLLAALAVSGQIFAQINNNDSGTEILKPFRAKLAESKKYDATPAQPKIDSQASKNLEYVVPTRLKDLVYPKPKLDPLDLVENNKKDNSKTPTFYARFGAGYPLSILGELSYHTKPNDKYRFGATFRHHSGRGNYNDNQRFMDNALRLQGAYFLKNGVGIDGGLGLNIDAPRFYGYGDTLILPKDSVAQQFTEINGNIAVFNARPNKMELNYRGFLRFHNLSDKHGSNEFSISPNINVEKWFGASKSNKKHLLVVDLGLNYVSLKDTFAALDTSLILRQDPNRLLLHFHPHFSYNGGVFRARVGGRLGLNAGDFYIYPDLEALASLLNGKVNVYAGWAGAVRQNNFRTLSQFNPFIVSYLDARHTAQQDFYGGIKGSIKKYNYDIRVAYSRAENLPFFLNDSLSSYRRFLVVYDTAQIFSLRAGLEFEIVKGLQFSTNLGFYAYSLNNLAKAYHVPNFESTFNLSYRRQKFEATAAFYVNSGVAYFDELTRTDKTLSGLFDFNLGASYNFTPNIGAFVQINNILNNQNQRWNRYPQIGFNALAGVKVSF
jgi:hypothetical protein